ncbi:MAG: hypothetical protein Q9168_006021 [Polycauliona sp. 1 TL-2023]
MGSRTAELASIISANTAKIDAHIVTNGIDALSFEGTSAQDMLSDPAIRAARQAVLEATDELHALMLGPVGILTTPPHNFNIALHAIYKFGIATGFPSDRSEVTFGNIASYSGLPEPDAKRILRHAMTYRIFREPKKGVVAHTAASRYLSKNPLMQQWVGMVSEEMWPAAVKGFNIAHNTDDPVFTELSKHSETEARYASAMSWFATGPGLDPSHIVNNIPPIESPHPRIVDVGGSHGAISIALARAYPSVQCVVQDRGDVVRTGREKLPRDLNDRVSFMEHDFFSEQPIKGADFYLLR